MVLGDAQHVADDRHRQPECKILDQVHMPLGHDPVECLVDDLLDARAHVLDPARGERLHHQAAQAGVIRRILHQHPVPHAAIHRFFQDLRAAAPRHPFDVVLAEALVAQHQADIGMPACEIHPERRQVHRIGGAQPFIGGIGIADKIRRERVEKLFCLRSLKMLVHGRLAAGIIALMRRCYVLRSRDAKG